MIKDANGTAVDAIIVEGTVIGTAGAANRLIANGSAKTIDEFLAFVKYNPTKLIGLKILVDNATQLEEKIYTKQNSPFRNLDDINIEPSNYKTSKDTDSLRAEVPIEEEIAFDNQTTMVHKILSGRTTTITWFFGAILNTAAALAKKSCKAKVTLDRIKAGGKGKGKRKPIRK